MKKFALLLGLVFLCSFVLGADISSDYYIYEKNVLIVHEISEIDYLEMEIPYDVKNVEVYGGDYTLDEGLLVIEDEKNVTIKFVTSSLVEKAKDYTYFVTKNYFSGSSVVHVHLPMGSILADEGIFFPESFSIDSDGKSIIVGWDDLNSEQIFVSYDFPKNNDWIYWIGSIVFILLLVGFVLYERNFYKKKFEKFKAENPISKDSDKENLTRNLFEDEKKIVEYLLTKENNECWTKEILKDLGISKVKLSRKLRSLEQKELIKKVPYGNENRIKLLKN